MAIGWYSVLKMVPWTEVISNAPQIADAARKLWGNVARKGGESAAADAPPPLAAGAPATAGERLAELQARVDAADAALAELHRQLVDSTALIDTLASQNALLVQRVEANRRLVRALVAAVAVLAVGTVAALWAALAGG